jgi:hypothetical protein
VKTTNGNTYGHTYLFCKSFGGRIIWLWGEIDTSYRYLKHPIPWSHHVTLFVLHFIFCFVKALRWWGVSRFAQPHVLTYMFCPYVISTPFTGYLKNTNENFQKIPSSCFLLTTLHLREPALLFNTTVFHRALASCCSRKIE